MPAFYHPAELLDWCRTTCGIQRGCCGEVRILDSFGYSRTHLELMCNTALYRTIYKTDTMVPTTVNNSSLASRFLARCTKDNQLSVYACFQTHLVPVNQRNVLNELLSPSPVRDRAHAKAMRAQKLLW